MDARKKCKTARLPLGVAMQIGGGGDGGGGHEGNGGGGGD
jgi:hypothetical protein